MSSLHVASVCTGIGGVDLSGLSRAPVVVAFGSESRTRRAKRYNRSLCGFNVVWSFSRHAISTRIGARQCACVIPPRGDPRAHARVPRMCELVCRNVDPRRSRGARRRWSLCGHIFVPSSFATLGDRSRRTMYRIACKIHTTSLCTSPCTSVIRRLSHASSFLVYM